jgi:hypothetical protein
VSVVIAPWLNTNPESFVNAAKSGAGVGAQLRGQDLENSARMAAIAQQGADAQLKANEESERNAIASEVAKNRIALQTQAAANIYQQQRQRQAAIDGGADPIQAWLQYPGTTSGTPGAGVFNALSQSRRASLPLEPVPDPNNPGRTAGFHDGNKFYALPQTKTPANVMDPKEKIAIDALTKQYSGIISKIATTPDADPSKSGMRRQALQLQQTLDKFGVPMGGPKAAPAAGPAAASQRGLPTQGQIINGHRYQGGDPADKNSWQEVNPEGSSFIGNPGQPNEAELPGDMQSPQPVPDETEDQDNAEQQQQ